MINIKNTDLITLNNKFSHFARESLNNKKPDAQYVSSQLKRYENQYKKINFGNALYKEIRHLPNLNCGCCGKKMISQTDLGQSFENITKPTKESIEKGEPSRCEMFAQTFAYAMGESDPYMEDWIKTFPNTYKLVLKYIDKHSK